MSYLNSKNSGLKPYMDSESRFVEDLTPVKLGKKSKTGGVCLKSGDGIAYVDDSDLNVLIESSTGTGKTSRVIVETGASCIQSNQSVFIYDPKMEAYRTLGPVARKMGREVVLLNFRNPFLSDAIDLLDPVIRRFRSDDPAERSHGIDMLNDLAATLVPVKKNEDPFWEESAQSMLIGLMLITLNLAEGREFVNLRSACAMKDALDVNSGLADYIMDLDDGDPIKLSLRGVIENSESTRRCIIGCFSMFMRLYTFHDGLTGMISTPEKDVFSMGERPMVVFMVVPDEKTTYSPLVSALVKMIYTELTDRALQRTDGALPVRVNFILDEFSNMSRIPDFPAMISAGRSRNIRFVLCVQSRYQLVSKYGANDTKTIIGNCGILIFMFSMEMDTLTDYSQRIGYDKNGSLLVYPQSLQTLEAGEVLVLRKGHLPYISHLAHMSEFGLKPQDVDLPKRKMSRVPVLDYDEALVHLRAKIHREEFERLIRAKNANEFADLFDLVDEVPED